MLLLLLLLCCVALLFWFARPLCAPPGCTFVLYLARAAVRFRTTLHELRRCLSHRGVLVSWFWGLCAHHWRAPLLRAMRMCVCAWVGWLVG